MFDNAKIGHIRHHLYTRKNTDLSAQGIVNFASFCLNDTEETSKQRSQKQ